MVRERRQQLEALLASAEARVERARARSLAVDTVVVLTAAAQVLVVAVLWLALSWRMRPVAVPWTALVPGACLLAGGTQGFALALTVYFAPRAARAVAAPVASRSSGRRGRKNSPMWVLLRWSVRVKSARGAARPHPRRVIVPGITLRG